MKNQKYLTWAIVAVCATPMLAFAGPPTPSVPEPTTVIAGAACLVPLAVGVLRAMRNTRK